MKKLFLGAAIAMSSLTFAQQFGVKAGMNVSSISADGFDDSSAKVGYYAGLFMNAPLAENFSIQPELIYNNLGAKTEYTVGSTTTSTSLNLDYITVPVMFQYNATPMFYLEAGPEFGFLVNANGKNSTGNNTTTVDLDTDNFNKFNMGIGLGAGLNITPKFGLNARYIAGLNDVTNNDDWGSDANNKNNNFQVGLSYKF